MSGEIDFSNNQANVAFLGSRENIWHRFGQEMKPGQTIEEWAKDAGLNWTAIKVPAAYDLSTVTGFSGYRNVPGWNHIVRSDTGAELGYVSENGYKLVQPRDLLEFTSRYFSVDERFQLDTAGSLRGGGRIWVSIKFNGDFTIGGDKHTAYVLACTGFDGTLATHNKLTTVRTVCNNTLSAALVDKRAMITTRHSNHFNPEAVAKELAGLAKSIDTYKQVGDAMAQVEFGYSEARDLFKKLLDIKPDTKAEDISTRKMNQFNDLARAYETTATETEKGTVWCALNAVTRYVDHDRSSRNGDSAESGRFDSAQFGSGAAFKAEAWNLLAPLVKDKVAA